MATIAELIDSRQYTRDSNGKEAGTRVFRVLEAQNEAGARDEFYALTDYNRFPGAGFGCVLDRVSVEGRNGNTLFIVTANYSSFKGFIKRDEPEESFQPYFGWGYKKATVTLPFVYQTTLTTSSGELQATKQVWSAKTIDIAEVRIARTLKVRYETDNSNTLDVIAEQDRKIHTIRGKKYLFTGADVQQDTKDSRIYIITYNWEQDNGTRFKPTQSMRIYLRGNAGPGLGLSAVAKIPSNDVSYLCGFDGTSFVDYIPSSLETTFLVRPPYTSIDITAPKDENSFPRPVLINQYDESPLGWQELPGMIPL